MAQEHYSPEALAQAVSYLRSIATLARTFEEWAQASCFPFVCAQAPTGETFTLDDGHLTVIVGHAWPGIMKPLTLTIDELEQLVDEYS
jgi:hypothetical protein